MLLLLLRAALECGILESFAERLAPEAEPIRVVATDYRLALPATVEQGCDASAW